jgi:hypothetical protein
VYDDEFCTDANVTVTEVLVVDVNETWGAPRGKRASESGADVVPTIDVAKLVPSPTDVMVAVNVSPVVSPENVKVPVVFPVIGVVEFAVTSWNVMVLERALGSGVKVTLIEVGVTWASVGAAGWASCGSVSVRGAETVPTDDDPKFVPSPIDVIVALYVSVGVSPEKSAVPDVLLVMEVGALVVVFVSVMVLETALGSGVNVTVMDVGVVWLNVGAAGFASCGSVSVRGVDAVPRGELEKFSPSPIDVIAALYVSVGVSPEKSDVPDVLPVIGVVAFVEVFVSVMVLDVACGLGVKFTVMEVVVVWLSVGAAGFGKGVRASVTDEETAPADELR